MIKYDQIWSNMIKSVWHEFCINLMCLIRCLLQLWKRWLDWWSINLESAPSSTPNGCQDCIALCWGCGKKSRSTPILLLLLRTGSTSTFLEDLINWGRNLLGSGGRDIGTVGMRASGGPLVEANFGDQRLCGFSIQATGIHSFTVELNFMLSATLIVSVHVLSTKISDSWDGV